MKSIVCTYFYGGNTNNIRALASSIRIFSQMKSMCVIARDVGSSAKNMLSGIFDRVEVADSPIDHIVNMDSYDRIMLLKSDFLMTSKMDYLMMNDDMGGSPSLSVQIIKPSRLISKLKTFDRDVDGIRQFFIDNGYKWKDLREYVSDEKTRTLIISGNYFKGKNGSVIDHLKDILGTTIGERGREAVEREQDTYLLVFTHQSVNPVSNYDTLEAYGDGFLKGAYMWVLESTPGIISADQITKIADHYGGRDVLAEIAERLDLVKYLNISERVDTKIKSDIMEALIGAIGFSHERLYGGGDEAVRKFVTSIYSTYKIDVSGYKKRYTSPIQQVNVLLQQLRLDSKMLVQHVDRDGRQIVVQVSYAGQIIGVGITPKEKNDIEGSIKRARNIAYTNIINNKSLEKFVTQ